MSKKKWGGLIGITCVVIITLIGLSNASYASKDEKINEFQTGQVDIEIQEVYTAPERWTGEDHIKNVSIKNNSNVKTLLRVAIVPRWVDGNGAPWAGDTSCVVIGFANLGTTKELNKWVKDKDYYYYYNGIVNEGQSTNELIKTVKATIPTELQERYKGKKLIIDVKAETIIATKEAYEKAWSGITDVALNQMLGALCG